VPLSSKADKAATDFARVRSDVNRICDSVIVGRVVLFDVSVATDASCRDRTDDNSVCDIKSYCVLRSRKGRTCATAASNGTALVFLGSPETAWTRRWNNERVEPRVRRPQAEDRSGQS